ncbi:MAG: AprI/Inh family metalloprotease inhibitor [Cohaesibacteraceae bacterium]|nr:AprI/Inh family metalloprotease inhibitor [Cohaesibacteraceae bacterium]
MQKIALIFICGGLVACQTTPQSAVYQTPQQPSVFSASGPSAGASQGAGTKSTLWQNGKRTSTSYVTADGTKITKTSTTSASATFNKAAAANALVSILGGMIADDPIPVTRQDLFGDWGLYAQGGQKSCKISFGSTQSFGAYRSKLGVACPSELFSSSKWNLLGNELVLIDGFGRISARLHQSQASRWDGKIEKTGAVIFIAR